MDTKYYTALCEPDQAYYLSRYDKWYSKHVVARMVDTKYKSADPYGAATAACLYLTCDKLQTFVCQ